MATRVILIEDLVFEPLKRTGCSQELWMVRYLDKVVGEVAESTFRTPAFTITWLDRSSIQLNTREEVVSHIISRVKIMTDPTYNCREIEANPVWRLAFALSEIQNEAAPIGWSKYIGIAKCLLALFDITPKEIKHDQ